MTDTTKSIRPAEVILPPKKVVYSLPLKLTIRDLRQTSTSVEADCMITDSDGVSIQFMPISMAAKTTPAEVVAILQATVKSMAENMHKRGEVVLETPELSTPSDYSDLVGKELYGSVAT